MKMIITIIFFSLTTGFAAQAQEVPKVCPEKPLDEDSARALAGTWFEKGVELADAEQYKGALGAFSCSIKMVEHPATLFNGASAARFAGDLDTALAMLGRIIELNPNPEMRKEAIQMLSEVRQEKLKAESSEEPKPEPAQEPPPQTPKAQENNNHPKQNVLAPEDKGKSKLRTSGFIVGGVGIAALCAGSVFQGLAGAAQKTTGETDDYSEYVQARDDVKTYQTVAIVGFVAGGVLLGTVLVIILVDGKEADDRTTVRLSSKLNGLTLEGSF